MIINFDEYIDRSNSDSRKWKKYYNRDIIPLWLADTDFKSPPSVIKALSNRITHGIFGYGYISTNLIDIFVERIQKKYKWSIQPEWLIFLPGVVSGLYLSVRTLTEINEGVIIPYPVYPPFYKAVHNSGRYCSMVPMHLLDNRWCVDFNNINNFLTNKEKMIMLCNPHNPMGISYNSTELNQYLTFIQKNNLFVCSDEIHCDLLLKKDIYHIPFGSLSKDAEQRSITLMSTSKTFNLAGLGASIAIIPNLDIRNKFILKREGIVPSVDILALIASYAALKDGDDWLNQQIDYLRSNLDLLSIYISNIPNLKFNPPEATFLAWIDVSNLEIIDPHLFFENAGVGMSAGKDFGNSKFVRLNFGCSKFLLKKALNRILYVCNKLK